MFEIEEKKDIAAPELKLTKSLFHDALIQGKEHYHVKGQNGLEFDIHYVKNNDYVPEKYKNNKKGIDIYPSYLSYDEELVEELDLSLLQEHDTIFFDVINEYTIVLSKLALQYTKADVYFKSELIYEFLDKNSKLFVSEVMPQIAEDKLLHVVDGFVSGTLEKNFHTMSSAPLFHSVFFWQEFGEASLAEIKYAEVGVTKSVGIGGVLSYFANAKKIFAKRNIKTYLREGASRYDDSMLSKYFCFEKIPNDSDESNTIYLEDITTLSMTYYYYKNTSEIDLTIFNKQFLNEIDEYASELLNGKKVLGVLIRGTDYIVSGMGGSRKMATVDDMVPTIRQWIAEDGYEKIFLATEDQDVLEKMRAEFGNTVIAVSQVRRRVSDFVGVSLISDLEKKEDDPAAVEDNTVNYFYALYILSRCDSFMASGLCHGWDVVNSFHEGDFIRSMIFQVGL